MAFGNDGGGMGPADVAAVMGRGGGNGWGFGGDGGAWWLLILFLFAFVGNGGWGNGANGGGNGGWYGVPTQAVVTQADMQRGFDQQATQAAISNVQQTLGNGFADAAIARCQGNAALTAAVTNGTYATTQAITGAQMANMQNTNQLAMALQNCCCENRAGLADVKYTVATENCADRQALNDGIRDVMAANTANTQAIIASQQQGFQGIHDKLCQLELDGFKQKVSDLQAENAALRGAASQSAQTAQILANNEAQTANLLARLNPAPVPAYMVQNPNCCAPVYNGCGCGCA